MKTKIKGDWEMGGINMNIEIFTGLDWYKVETAVNDFITLPRVAVKDIQFSTVASSNRHYDVEYGVMVVYEDLADVEVEVEQTVDCSKPKQILEVLKHIKNECYKQECCKDSCEFWDFIDHRCIFDAEFPVAWDLGALGRADAEVE